MNMRQLWNDFRIAILTIAAIFGLAGGVVGAITGFAIKTNMVDENKKRSIENSKKIMNIETCLEGIKKDVQYLSDMKDDINYIRSRVDQIADKK